MWSGGKNQSIFDFATDVRGNIFATGGGSGILYSRDDGLTWESRIGEFGETLRSARTIALGLDRIVYAGTPHRVLRSTNLGLNWTLLRTGFERTDEWTGRETLGITALTVSPTGSVYAGYSDGIIRSDDAGKTWLKITDSTLGELPSVVTSITLTPTGTILAGTIDGGLLRASGERHTWSRQLPNSTIASIAVSARGIVFASTSEGLYCSFDDGVTWAVSETSISFGSFWKILVNPMGHIVGANHHGVFVSRDGGRNWWPMSDGITNLIILDLTVDANGRLFAITPGEGIFTSSDKGETWSKSFIGSVPGSSLRAIRLNSKGHLFVAGGSGVYRSTDEGNNWVQTNAGITEPYLTLLCIAPNDAVYVVAQNRGVFRSTDNGDSWVEANNGLKSGRWAQVSSLFVDQNGIVYAGHSEGVFRSTNHGDSWYRILPSQRDDFPALTASDKGTILACQLGPMGSVFRSRDEGNTWMKTASLNEIDHPQVIRYLPNGDVLLGGFRGMLMSKDDGITWIRSDEGLTNLVVYSIATRLNGRVYAGTSAGVFSATYIVSSVSESNPEKAAAFALRQNCPNPFNASTTITFSISRESPAALEVFNLLGKRVETLLSGRVIPGEHRISWFPSQLPGGVYFYRLSVGNQSQIGRMVYLK